MNCKDCGAEISKQARYCSSCGTAFPTDTSQSFNERFDTGTGVQNKGIKIAILNNKKVILTSVCLITVIILFFVFNTGNSDTAVHGIGFGSTKQQIIDKLGFPIEKSGRQGSIETYNYSGVRYGIKNDKVSTIEVTSQDYKNSNGIIVGTPLQKVVDIYGSEKLRKHPQSMGTVMAKKGSDVIVAYKFQLATGNRLFDDAVVRSITWYKDKEMYESWKTFVKFDYIK